MGEGFAAPSKCWSTASGPHPGSHPWDQRSARLRYDERRWTRTPALPVRRESRRGRHGSYGRRATRTSIEGASLPWVANRMLASTGGRTKAFGLSSKDRSATSPLISTTTPTSPACGASEESSLTGSERSSLSASGTRFHPSCSDDIYVVPEPYRFNFDAGPHTVMHLSPWSCDTQRSVHLRGRLD